MSTYVDREGTFRGLITEYGVKQNKKDGTTTYTLSIRAQLHEIFNPDSGEWDDWRAAGVTCDGFLNLVKRDGGWNEAQVVSIREHGGWDGKFISLQEQTWSPSLCQFDVKINSYNGNDSYRIDWLAAYDRVPGGLGNCTPEVAREMDARLGSSMRALTGNIQRAKTAPSGEPAAPAPIPQAAPAAPATPPQAPPAPAGDDIPF